MIYFFLAYNSNLTVKEYGKSLSHLIWLFLYIYHFSEIYRLEGYVLLSILATIIEFVGYIVFITLVNDENIFMEIYKDKSL